jgi:proline iminopeptidase
MFGAFAGSLDDQVRVVRWDQRGCGRSERRGPYRLARSVADLEAVRAHLRLDRVAVLGHSWGATLALRHALDHPDRVSALIYDRFGDVLRDHLNRINVDRYYPRGR